MNREQHLREQRRKGISGSPLIQQQQCSIDYGHNGQVVVMQFTAKIQNLMLSEAQVDGMITGLQSAKAALMAHKAATARDGGPGHG